MNNNRLFYSVIISLILISCTNIKKEAGQQNQTTNKSNVVLQNIKVDFKQEADKLDISFSTSIPLNLVTLITIKGKNIGEFSFDDTLKNNLQLDITNLPQGPHLFKFQLNNGKEINEVFRINNQTSNQD